jgi:hypothetical protein
LREAADDANDRGVEFYKKGDWDNAIKCFTEALEYDPDDDVASFNLSYTKKKKLETAAIEKSKAAKEAPAAANKPRKVTAYTIGLDTAQGEFSIENSDGSKLTNKSIQAGRGARVDTGTRVTTGPTGRLRIVLPDETVFTIGPNSDMVIDEFVFDPDNSAKKILVRLSIGTFRWVTGKVAPRKDPASMKVTLPVMAVGIRGTDFETFVKPDGSGYVKLFSGTLEITPKKGGTMFVMKGKSMVKFKRDGTFSKPEGIK